ncbi:unnamed protein product, partial [marine sediment metagenome]
VCSSSGNSPQPQLRVIELVAVPSELVAVAVSVQVSPGSLRLT